MPSHATLKNQLENQLVAINAQIEEVDMAARIVGCAPRFLRLADGSWPLNELLLAKSSVLLGLSNLALTNKK